MLETVRKLLQIISPELRKKFFYVELHTLASAMIDTLAFALLYPLLRIATDYNGSKSWYPVREAGILLHAHSKGQLELRFGLVIVATFIASSVVGLLLTYRQAVMTSAMEEDISTRIFVDYMEVPYLDHVSHNSSDLVRNTHALPTEATVFGALSVLVLTQNLLITILLIAVLAVVNPIVVGVSIVYFGLGVYFYSRFFSERTATAGERIVELSGTCLRIMQEGFSGLKSYRSGNAAPAIYDAYKKERRQLATMRSKVTLYTQLPQYYLQSVMIGGVILFITVVVLVHSSNTTALIGIVIAAFLRLFPALYATLNCSNKIRAAQGGIEELHSEFARMNEMASHDSSIRATTVKHSSEVEPTDHQVADRLIWSSHIRFADVGFRYPSSSSNALDHLTFEIAKGSFVGIIGPSGAGKTTIVDMLLGLFLPTSGSVLIDDQLMTGETIDHWRNCVGYVPQEGFLIDGSVRENVAFGAPPEEVDEEKVWNVLERAQLIEDISRIPQGLDTRLGERGVKLSGGQRQRVGIARALYRDPEVLILDEATSALDVATEAAITATVQALGSHLTRIAVAHRLSTVRGCDDLLLIRRGHLEASGDFESLHRENQYFRELANLARID